MRSACESTTLSYTGRKRATGGSLRIGQRTIGHVEQLAAVLVAERPQTRAETLEDFGERAQTRPGPGVAHGGRAERGEVATDQRVGRALLAEGTAQPRLEGCAARLATRSPDAAREVCTSGTR